MKNSLKIFKVVILTLIISSGLVLSGCKEQKTKEAEQGQKTTSESDVSSEKLTTAKEAFNLAQTEAKNWSSDAVLVDLSNFRGTSETNGQSTRWKVEFNSKNKDKELEVHISQGKVLQKTEEKYKERDAITDEWLDSSETMKIALGRFPEKEAENYWLGLNSNGEVAVWKIDMRPTEGSTVSIRINASTGDLIET